MGVRVEYWEIPKSDIKKAIIDDLAQIKEWYESIGEEFPEDINYDVLEGLENISNPDKLFEEFDQNKIDELIALYISDFYTAGLGTKNEIKGTTMLYLQNYINEQKTVNERCNISTRQLWNYIIKGRSILESNTFNISDPIFRFCFFTESECQAILKDLEDHFNTSAPGSFNKMPGIGSVIRAIKNKKGTGILITVA